MSHEGRCDQLEDSVVVRLCKYGRGEVVEFITFGISGPNVGTVGLSIEVMVSFHNGL